MFMKGKRVKALLASAWLTVMAMAPGMAHATFTTASRTVGYNATSFGGIVKQDYHPENLFIQGYWSNGTAAGGTSGGAASLGQSDVGSTGGTVNAGVGDHQQTVGGAVLTTANSVQLTYGGVGNSTASYGGGAQSGSTDGLVTSGAGYGLNAALTGSDAALAGAGILTGPGAAGLVTAGEGGLVAGAGGGLAGSNTVAAIAGAADVTAGSAAASALEVIASAAPYIAVVFTIVAIFDLFGSGITYSWSGSCAARTGAPCGGYYDNAGYKHIGYGIYVPSSAMSEVQNDVNLQQLGASMSTVLADKNTDPNAIFDGSGRKLAGNYSTYMDQGSGLLLGYHPRPSSVLITNVVQISQNGWNQETVYQGVNNVPLYMYTYNPQVAWDGTN